jgi:short-subunit dehydrogenase
MASERAAQAILITGCSSGIGHATALHLAKAGRNVYATARDPAELEELARAGCKTLALDVTDDESARAAVAQIEAAEGDVWGLVNNAGFSNSGAVEAMSMNSIRRQYETNVFGYVRMSQLVLPGMRRQGAGRIVNVSSVAGRVTMPGSGVYSSTKFAIEALSDALRFEVARFGVQVVIVEPGPTRTAFTDTANAGMAAGAETAAYDEYHRAVAKADKEGDASGLASDPEDVAKVIATALTARRPKPRYRVSFVVRLLPGLRAALGGRGFDLFLRTQVPPPGPGSSS